MSNKEFITFSRFSLKITKKNSWVVFFFSVGACKMRVNKYPREPLFKLSWMIAQPPPADLVDEPSLGGRRSGCEKGLSTRF